MRLKKRKSLMKFIAQRRVSLPEQHAMLTKVELIDWMIKQNLVMEPTPKGEEVAGVRRLRIHVPKRGGKALPMAGIGIFSRDAGAQYSLRRDGGPSEPAEHHDSGEGVHFIPVADDDDPANSPHTYVIEKALPPPSEEPVIVDQEKQARNSSCTIM